MEMEDDQQQQQRPHSIHSNILCGIALLADSRCRDERHKLHVNPYWISTRPALDRRSLQHLVHFLDNDDSHEVTELVCKAISLLQPSDGGLNVLRSFFARSDTTLTKVTLFSCNFGSAQEASQLIGAFQTNTTVTDLTIQHISNLEGAALGQCLSGAMQSMPQLQRLDCSGHLRVEGVRVFQPAMQANRTLKEFDLSSCFLEDDSIRIIADSLVGNTTIKVLDIRHNGLDGITRLLESTQIKTIDLRHNDGIFNDGSSRSSTQRFARVLSRHEFLKDLHLASCGLGDAGIHLIVDGLVGNTIMEVLNINGNIITSVGLADITRMIESTQIKTIAFWGNQGVFNDEEATQQFVTSLQHQKSRVQELPGITLLSFPQDDNRGASYASIEHSLRRNQQLNRANLLLAPPPLPPPQQQRNAGTMMLKLSHKAITKFAMVPNNAGASAIFTLFQARPALLEKRIKRPTAAAAVSQEQKRRRL